MAVGLPLKTTYADGDVYAASDVNDTNGTINITAAPYAAGKNKIINGAFNIWQRGTSFVPNATAYSADRWLAYRAVTGSTFSRQATGALNSNYYMRMQRDSGNSSTSIIYLTYSLETLDSKPLAGQTVTLSWYARKGANFSGASSNMSYDMQYGTGTDQNVLGFTGSTSVMSGTKTLTSSFERFTATGTLNSATNEIGFSFSWTPVGTAGAADYIDISNVQLEVGSTATAFQTATGTIQGELAACQRYFWQIATGSGTSFALASAEGSNTPLTVIQAPVTMRIAPTLVQTTGSAYYVIRSNSGINTFSSFTTDNNSVNGITVYTTGATITAGYAGRFITNNASSSLGLSAEL